ncbi:MAG: (2Fe-2S)-binding protein [Acidiferrobacterales bacterium]|nr:(2Fe-2S)-binding protein [Acidiferrobacterales bacterium]
MFKRITGTETTLIEIFLNDVPVMVPDDINVGAAILLRSSYCRKTVVSGSPRGPFCMMGACFDCFVEINGKMNQQACLQQVEAGMRIGFQVGPANLSAEETC